MEHYYVIFDRAVVDPLWKTPWNDFLRGRPRAAVAELSEFVDFAVDAEISAASLKTKTLRWIIQNSSPQFHTIATLLWFAFPFVGCAAVKVPSGEAICAAGNADFAAILSCAVQAFRNRLITETTLTSVLRLHLITDIREFLKLSENDARAVNVRVKRALQGLRPLYRWQQDFDKVFDQSDGCIGVPDTRCFLDFLDKAWTNNWTVPWRGTVDRSMMDSSAFLRDDQTPDRMPGFREFALAWEFNRVISKACSQFKKPVAFRRWE